MTTPINVDEARVALKTWSLRIPKAQMALLNTALDRLEELEACHQGIHIPEAGEALQRLIQNKSVSLQEASFLSTAINRAEEVPALSVERDAAIRQARLADGHAKRMTESVVCVEAERDALKAQVAQLEADHSDGEKTLLASLHAALDERDAAQAQCAEAERAAHRAELRCVENLQALCAATQNNGVLHAQLETAKGQLKRYRKGLSQEHITTIDVDCGALLSSKEGGE